MKKILPLISLGLMLASCAHRHGCPPIPDFPSESAENGFTPVHPVHELITADLQKGFLRVSADGDLFFLPPDTLRLQVRAEWGEVLADIRDVGGALSVSTPGGEQPVGHDSLTLSLINKGALPALFSGRPGLRHCLDTVNRKVTCENNVPVYQDKRWCVTLNAKGNRLASVESLDKRFFYEVLSEERVEGEWLPKVFRFRMAEGPSMTLRVEKRLTDKIFTGAAILK